MRMQPGWGVVARRRLLARDGMPGEPVADLPWESVYYLGDVSVPLSASQTFTVMSPLPLTMRLPSGLNATLVTWFLCPLRVSVSVPLSASQTFTVQSSLPLTMRLPSGLNATLVTLLLCPLRVS